MIQTRPLKFAIAPLIARVSLFLFTGTIHAEPTVPGLKITTYAAVVDPIKIAFDQSNALYVGRDASGSGGNSSLPVKIHRIGAGGSPVEEFGITAILDPDAVIVDTSGTFAPIGSILVGGIFDTSKGQILSIEPDQSISTLFGPATNYWNPTDFAFDSSGRLFFTNFDNRPTGTTPGVYSTDSPTTAPSILIATGAEPAAIATDSQDRLYVSTVDERIRLYRNNGRVIDDSFVDGIVATALVVGNLGGTGEALYASNSAGDLLCVTMSGVAIVIGTGFSDVRGLALDSEGALYVSEFSQDRILRIERATEPSIAISNHSDDSFELIFEGILQSSDTLEHGSWADLAPQPTTPFLFTPSPFEPRMFWRARTWNGCTP